MVGTKDRQKREVLSVKSIRLIGFHIFYSPILHQTSLYKQAITVN